MARSISTTKDAKIPLTFSRKSNSNRGFHMLCAKKSSKLGTVEADEERLFPSIVRGNNNPKEKRLRARTHKKPRNAREMHNKHDEPDGEHKDNSYFLGGPKSAHSLPRCPL